ncbi:MAG: hypothetical protein QOJ26_857 [Thermoplasmata archaeon]|jgi:hypothetical protein|nr:hypothetical protein [Thermoplasmata archaeon]MEA3165988.1 hypothetical protein [Thermoplasmata archaeon]
MARRLNTLNFVYTAIGIGVAAGVGYYAYRQLRNRRLEGGATEDSLMDIRRSTRKAGRAVKDTVAQVGKSVKRGAKDLRESVEETAENARPLIEQDSSGYNRA